MSVGFNQYYCRMLNSNCYFLLALVVFTISTATAEEKDSCDLLNASTNLTCKVLAKLYPQDNGKLSKYLCGCVVAFMTGDTALCHAEEYDFAVSPRCGELFKSKEFQIEGKHKDNLINKYTMIIYEDEVKVCTEKNEDKLIRIASLLYLPGITSRIRTLMFENASPCAVTTELLLGCHGELLELAKKQAQK